MIVTRISGVLGAIMVGAGLLGAPATAAPKASSHAAAVDYVVSVRPSDEFRQKLVSNYGLREFDILAEDLAREVNLAMAKADPGDRKFVLIVHDATPNRPTFEQLGKVIGLDYQRSFGIGGADVEAQILTEKGELLRSFRLKWDEQSISLFEPGSDTWFDARRAFYFFASGLRKSLAKEATGKES